MVQAVNEQRPVGQAGERIGEGLAVEAILELFVLGHVAVVEDDAVDNRVVGPIGGRDAQPAPFAVGAAHRQLDFLLGAGRGGHAAQHGLGARAGARVDELKR